LVRTGFRYGDDAPMAIIELVDRDFNAKKIDIKKKADNKSNIKPPSKSKDTDKKSKIKK
jgi:large subunit ribosomal protein L17